MQQQSDWTLFIILSILGVLFLVLVWYAFFKKPSQRKAVPLKIYLRRPACNPLFGPDDGEAWESSGAFNPTALLLGGFVHLLYRAVGMDGVSRIGYAKTKTGYTLLERSRHPVYSPRDEFEGVGSPVRGFKPDTFGSGGGWGGCEDPKVVNIDGRVYMTYVSHNGWRPQRIAITSISEEDFLNKRWEKWTRGKLITRPDIITKSAIIFPEKVGGKYVVMHRVFPDILIDYVDDLDFADGSYLGTKAKITIRKDNWDSQKLSAAASPIRTRLGWLLIYHAVDDNDSHAYKTGAMILDINDPAKVLYRTNWPILSPKAHYENDWKPGIVYPGGAVVLGEKLFVYYGGGDKYSCVATVGLEDLLKTLEHHPVY